MKEKLYSLQEAVSRFVKDGDVVAVGGVGRNRAPMALVREIVRQGKRNLHIVGREKGMDFDMLIGAGCEKGILRPGKPGGVRPGHELQAQGPGR